MKKGDIMKEKLLLFGFEDLPSILAVQVAVAPLGIEVVSVPRADYGKTMAVLAGLEREKAPSGPDSGLPLGGRMMVLVGLTDKVEQVLPLLRSAGAGCLKAVLTPNNRTWNARRLYGELSREHRAFQGGK